MQGLPHGFCQHFEGLFLWIGPFYWMLDLLTRRILGALGVDKVLLLCLGLLVSQLHAAFFLNLREVQLQLPVAFLLFRLFDIWKPGPIGRADRRGDAPGVMYDDLWAGLFAGGAIMLAAGLYHGILMR